MWGCLRCFAHYLFFLELSNLCKRRANAYLDVLQSQEASQRCLDHSCVAGYPFSTSWEGPWWVLCYVVDYLNHQWFREWEVSGISIKQSLLVMIPREMKMVIKYIDRFTCLNKHILFPVRRLRIGFQYNQGKMWIR